LQRIYADAVWLQTLVVEELRPRPGRVRTAVRMAFIAATGAAAMAALHIDGALGPVTLWVALYASTSMMTASEGALLVLTYVPTLIASVVLAGILVDTPWLLLPFFALATALMTYWLNRRRLVGAWFNVAVGFLDTFYLCVFDPQNFGWSVAYTFSGIALGIGVLVAFDMVLWPDPAEPKLLRSLADTLDRQSHRLTAVGRAYLDPLAAGVFPPPAVLSTLLVQLPLLERVRRELADPEREAILLAAVTKTERLHIAIERLLATARADVSWNVRADLRPEMAAALRAIAAAIGQQAQQAATGLRPSDDATYEEYAAAIGASLDALQAREDAALSQLPSTDAAALANLAAFDEGLRKMGGRLLHRPLGHVYGVAFPKETLRGAVASGGADRALMRYSAKIGLAATLAYIVALTSHRADLGVTVWTAMIAGLQTYGATLRKMGLRIVGGVIGGLLTLLVIAVVSRNFESLGPYFAAFFVVLFLAGYVGLSSGRLAYAGQQAGVSFVVAYAALRPTDDFYAPLWRVWGIFLGLVIVTAVFLLVAPEYAGTSLVRRLQAVLQRAVQLLDPAMDATVERVQEIDMEVTVHLTHVLTIAEDARLEGGRSGLDPDQVIEAAGTLRRIVHRLSGIASARLDPAQPTLPADLGAARAAYETALRDRLESWLRVLQEQPRPDSSHIPDVAPQRPADDLDATLGALEERFSRSAARAEETLPTHARTRLLAEMESYRRLRVLVRELGDHLVRIPVTVRP
jgi:uncharacterized membrane protein YccC